MCRRWLLSLLCLALLLLSLDQLTHADGELRVNETATKVLFQNEPATVLLAVENLTGEPVNARIEVELLTSQDESKAKSSQLQTIATGKQNLSLPLGMSFSDLNYDAHRELLWYRLHYRVRAAESNTILTEGFISLSGITPDLIDLHLTTSEFAREGGRYRARVHASHPISLKPVGNVSLEAELTLEEDENDEGRNIKLRANRVTDSRGHAVLEFVLPKRFPQYPHSRRPSGGQLRVTGKRNGVTAYVSGDVLVDQSSKILISTDKPLYQPGQIMHVRALVFSPGKQALANQDVQLKISDPESTAVYRTVVKSSRFGVASADWSIPDNVRLGDYQITVGVDEDSYNYYNVRVSRYDLPNFSVSVEPDRKYYLPGQNAEIKVRADYLFGQPVTKGKVRVVRENRREWNYREQKWDIDEGEHYEGATDANGFFVARVDLAEHHKELKETDYSDFEDITYGAYFTDPTTNRTEQRRFDLRVTKEAIHIYVVRPDDTTEANRQLPLDFFVSTFYADGTPARCEVRSKIVDPDETDSGFKKLLPTIQTNRYGLAKVTGVRLPSEVEEDDEIELVITASDSQRRTGSESRRYNVEDRSMIRIDADKTLYRAGEPINAVITSTFKSEIVNVDLVRDATVIRSERVRLYGGRGSLTIPYRSDLSDRLTLGAYVDLPNSPSEMSSDTILYPRNADLKVNLRTSQASYRPGEHANVSLNVDAPMGRSAESALGVVVFDKAVEERFRTDQEFGQRASNFYQSLQAFLGIDEQVAGVSLGDLQKLDMSKRVSPDMELLADVLLNRSTRYSPTLHSSGHFERNATVYFRLPLQKELAPITAALTRRYSWSKEHPNSPESLRRLLRESQVDLDAFRDPWGTSYRPDFSVERENDVFDLKTAGPDKRFDTTDDFAVTSLRWKYFPPTGAKVDDAVKNYHERTGGFIRDFNTLRDESLKVGLNLDELRDRWGQPYRYTFTVNESKYLITVGSAGPDKQFSPYHYAQDDFPIWTSSIDYFAEKREQLQAALTKYFDQTKRFPQTDQELREALPGEDIDALRDPWGRTYYRTFQKRNEYADRVRIINRSAVGTAASQQLEITPVTRMTGFVNLRSVGPDGAAGTVDDFSIATFSTILSEQQRNEAQARQLPAGAVVSPTNGIVHGTVTDSIAAVVPNASVVLRLPVENVEFVTTTDDEGKYVFANLKPGLYQLRVEATGFKVSIVEGVWVTTGIVTEINTSLEPGAITETVTVSSGAFNLMATELSTVGNARRMIVVTKSGVAMETPRLREYFPETLLWQPSIVTDKQGRARVNFKLADNITTWKVAVVASTEDGLIATSEKEIKAFQPFFVEHEPPRVLTEGDEISLPVVVRNYLETEQKVDLQIKPESWFSLLGPAQKRTVVVAGDAKRETFDFRVIGSIDDGKQRITAIGADANDAIEKPVNVHPDGEEVSVTDGGIVGETGSLQIQLPENSIPKSSRAELKIYPNLLGHVVESIEAIMSRPYGCAEQTISSTYPSLLLLRYQKQHVEEKALRARAQRYLANGYSRLLNYREEDGGFSYWGRGSNDIALTAYALRFLTDAADVMDVDLKVIREAQEWLIKQQQTDGRWNAFTYGRTEEEPRRTALLTAYVVRVLATTSARLKSLEQTSGAVSEAQKRALDYLSTRAREVDEPYMLASFALALVDSGDLQRAGPIVDKLRSLAHTEGSMVYWSLETNTPFYGWGLAGRVETSALVVQALNRYCKSNGVTCASDGEMVERGLLFLLKQKDRYGVWYSTQATINVLDALLTMLLPQGDTSRASMAEIVVNGRAMKTIEMPAANRLVGPVTVDLTQFVRTGKNVVEIKRPSGAAFASAQARLNYYVPWPRETSTHHAAQDTKNGLRLSAKFDKTEAGITDTITCHVEAERIGFKGYGMMLAEIGLPPGADVDRASLEAAMKESGWGVTQYDVLPDRVVVYLWPQAGGVKFDFKFRPRFGLNAKAAPSVLYDYYNPEARVTVAPEKFRVK